MTSPKLGAKSGYVRKRSESESTDNLPKQKRLKVSEKGYFKTLTPDSLENIPKFLTPEEQRVFAQTNKELNMALTNARIKHQESLKIGENSNIYIALQSFIPNKPFKNVILKELVINGNNGLNEDTLEFIALNFPKLEHLDIGGSPSLTDESLKKLPKSLKKLHLSYYNNNHGTAVQITNEALENLPKTLTSLKLEDCDDIDDEGIATHLVGMELTTLSLHFCDSMTDNCFHDLAKLPLESLELGSWDSMTDNGLKTFGENCKTLKTLNLENLKKLTDVGLAHISKMSLENLELGFLDSMTDNGLKILGENCKTLKTLKLENLINLTDAGLAHLSKMPLNTLKLENLKNITDVGLAHLSKMPLKHIEVKSCPNVTNEAIDNLIYDSILRSLKPE